MQYNFLLIPLLSATLLADPPAFPGALGFGANATGGRNGAVYHVTNLNDNGAGSFRDAVSTSNRIVIFDTCGYISLKTAVLVNSNITIAGQTAPGEGIGFKSGEISFAKGSNIICRYIRVRPGSETESDKDDALSLYRAKNAILDHCSFEYGPWNNIDGVSDDWQNSPVTDITFQNCIIANPTGQQFGAHCESVSSQWSWFYCLFANSHNRNPLAKVNDHFINNILYNYSAGYTTHTSTPFKHDIINNHFIFGPASTGTDNTWFQVDKNQSIYTSGNIKDNNLDGVLNGDTTTPYWYQGVGTVLSKPWSPLPDSMPVYSSTTAFYLVASLAGTLPRDQSDSLIMGQVKTLGKGSTGFTSGTRGPSSALYTSQTQTGLENNGYGIIRGGIKEVDSDKDGMPDFWEKCVGTNLNLDDAMEPAADGYVQIEHYINWLGDFHAKTYCGRSVTIDLTQLLQDFFAVQSTFSITDSKNGESVISSDGKVITFTPDDGFHGLGYITFSISGPEITSYRNQVAIAVIPTEITHIDNTSFPTVKKIQHSLVFTSSGVTVNGHGNCTITLFDPAGRMIMRRELHSSAASEHFTFPPNIPHFFIVKLTSTMETTWQRIMITK